jgi:hypothetical protein
MDVNKLRIKGDNQAPQEEMFFFIALNLRMGHDQHYKMK